MKDFLEWAMDYRRPDWISLSVMFISTFSGLAWIMSCIALLANHYVLEAALTFGVPMVLLFREIWKEYRADKAEGHS